MNSTFGSLVVRNYRLYAAGGVISHVGTWMGRVGQDWLVLTQLTDLSSTALGIVTGLQFLPFLVLAPWAGLVADRFSKRRVLLISQSVLLGTALVLALLTLTGLVELWHVYALAFLQGLATAVDNPTRHAFVAEIVGPDRVANAVALNSASFNTGRLLGPAAAGLLIAAYGIGPALLANAVSFVPMLAALLAMRAAELRPAPRAPGRAGVRDGLRYVRGRPDLKLVMLLVFVLGTFGMNFQITTALMATTVFGKGATEYGVLGSIMAVGSVSAALLAARRARPRLRVLFGALAGFTVTSGVAATAPTYPVFAAALAGCGLTALTALTTANAVVQLSTEPSMRGRVMALYMAIFFGGTPLGAPVIGWLGDVAGARWTIGVGAVAVGAAVLVVSWVAVRRENVRVSHVSHRRPHWRLTVGPDAERPARAMPEVRR
ncbi:MAG: MFS transporter [Actinomycetales bacterium]|nr:MAG: MFS transporter [Actinomycetales bacterium]